MLLSPDGHSARHYRLLAHLVEHFEDALDNPDTSEREALDEVAPGGSAKVTLSAWEKLRAFDRLPLSAFKPQLS